MNCHLQLYLKQPTIATKGTLQTWPRLAHVVTTSVPRLQSASQINAKIRVSVSLKSVVVRFKLQPALLEQHDKAVVGQYATRSEFIRQAILEKIRNLQQPTPVLTTLPIPTGEQELSDLFSEVRYAYGRMQYRKTQTRNRRQSNR